MEVEIGAGVCVQEAVWHWVEVKISAHVKTKPAGHTILMS